jgi:hypothetical protein
MARRNMHGRFDWEAVRLERQQLLEQLDADMSADERAELAAWQRAARRARRLGASVPLAEVMAATSEGCGASPTAQ